MKLGDLRNCFLSFLDDFFFCPDRSGSEAPKVLSAFDPGCRIGESSWLLWLEYREPGVAVLGEALGRRGRGNEILKLRAIVVGGVAGTSENRIN